MLSNRSYYVIWGCILLMLSPFFIQAAHAQNALDPVRFTVEPGSDSVKAGETFTVDLDAKIDGNWHLYSIKNKPSQGPVPTSFSIVDNNAEIDGDVVESEAEIAYDPNFDTELGWHTGSAQFTVPVTLLRPSDSDSAEINISARYMVCDDKSCLPPKTKAISFNVVSNGVLAGYTPPPESGNESPANSEEETITEAEGKTSNVGGLFGDGLLSFLWIAVTAGFAALITPCVFPMIPLTVSYFSKDADQSSAKSGIGQALLFGLSIVFTFTLLGGILSLILGASGANQFAANPWVNLFIGLILILFAVSLLGMFELRLPYQVTNYLNRKSNESSGFIGIIFMALTISAVSFSCTAPFVGGVLAATTGGEWFYPLIGMAAFATAFSTPFILFAMFPGWLESMPKSGSWMNVVKVTLGFIELAAAVKFISNADLVWNWGIVSRPFAISIWIVVFLLAGFYILGFYQLNHDQKPKQIGPGRLLFSLPFLLFSFYLLPGLMGASLGIWDAWLPPKQATDVSVVASVVGSGGTNSGNMSEENWSEDYESSISEAKENNQPVFIDFTGYTCTNCRAMETNVFPLEGVQKHFQKMEKVRLYTDDGTKGPENQQFQFKLTGTVALPTYVIVNPQNGKIIDQLVGYTNKEKFTAFLDQGLARFHSL